MGWTFPLPSYSPRRVASLYWPWRHVDIVPSLCQAAMLSLMSSEVTSRPWLFHPCFCWESLMKVEAISIPRTRGLLASSQGCVHHRKKKKKRVVMDLLKPSLLSAHIPWPSKKVSALILHGRGIESEVFPVAFNTTIMKRVCQPRCWMSFKGRFPENNQQKWSK